MGKRENAQERRQRREQKKEKKKKASEKESKKAAEAAAAAAVQEKDIEEILKELNEQAKKGDVKPSDNVVKPPSPRSSASFLPHPVTDELVLFGGEFFNGSKTYLYNDLFFYNPKKDEWKQIVRPGAPPPRCSHQAVMLAQNGGEMWVFGGEFASPTGAQFYHYNDLYCFRFAEKTWEKYDVKGGPSPRSGHRMCVFKRNLVVFGGFHDNQKKAPKYFNDVHLFNLDTFTWGKINFPPIHLSPSPRSAVQMVATQDFVVVFGGYAKERLKGDNYKGVTYTDMWRLTAEELPPAPQGSESGDSGAGKAKASPAASQERICHGFRWSWESQKQSGAVPGERCGASACLRNPTMAVSFGGVCDEETEDALQGQFFNDLFFVDLVNNKWFPVELKTPKVSSKELDEIMAEKKKSKKKKKKKDKKDKKDAKAGKKEAKDAAAEESSDSSESESESEEEGEEGGASAASAAAAKKDESPAVPQDEFWPSPRMNAMLATKGSILYLYGGMYEVGDRQLTLSDMYSLDMSKLVKWTTLAQMDERTKQWMEEEESSSSEDEDEEGEEGEEESEGEADKKKGKKK